VLIAVVTKLGAAAIRLVPGLRVAEQLNCETARKRLEKQSYADNMMWNRKWDLSSPR